MLIPEAQIRAIGKFDAHGRLVANVTSPEVDSLMLAGCGHPEWARVRAPALVIDAVTDSAPQIFPQWAAYDSAAQASGRRFWARLEEWELTQRVLRAQGMPGATVLALPGANHYVFDSHREAVTAAMREFLGRLGG